MIETTILGFPRIGARRELKTALERYWAGKSTAGDLLATAAGLRAAAWAQQAAAGLGELPVGDFALYDHVLDMALTLDAVPARFRRGAEGAAPLDLAFAMARGGRLGGGEVTALEMTKWLDTNYHYLVPELDPDMTFRLAWPAQREAFQEAAALGHRGRPVILGPISFLRFAKSTAPAVPTLDLLDRLLPAYEALLADLAAAGAASIQIDEPALVLDPIPGEEEALRRAFTRLKAAAPASRLWLAAYHGPIAQELLPTVLGLPIDVLHLDLVRGGEQLAAVVEAAPERLSLSLGVVDGRNVWITDLDRAVALVRGVVDRRGAERVVVASSCSLMHVPYDAAPEGDLDPELHAWLAFARQKLDEIRVIAAAVDGRAEVTDALARNRRAIDSRGRSARAHDGAVRARLAAVTPEMTRRSEPYAARRRAQQATLPLPLLPTTTIGSFPQTREVRAARAAHRRGETDAATYAGFLEAETARAVALQEEIGLDVLVHGEFERTDMVEYFGEHLDGFAFTRQGWVQSYGSRCVKPPIIHGDVSRARPITVGWARYAQSLTRRPMKGMLTGPVTILQWSFVRDDQPRELTCRQIALAIRDEVADLETAGIRVIQIDEPALREGLPLRRRDWPAYLDWAGGCFRLATAVVAAGTQIHTHMCYSEFNDIIEAIAALDADVISIETARSRMELLQAFAVFSYPNEIGPGVYDIHSPRVPTADEMAALLRKAAERLPVDRLWVNPDCGLKTRGWPETREALVNMVAAARSLRAELGR